MPRLSPAGRWWGAIAAVAFVAACDDFASRNPAQPSLPVAGSLEIVGPASIPPGQSAQYVARLRLSDGTFKNAANAVWSSSNSSVVRVISSGEATAHARGDAVVRATVTVPGGTRGGSREILVLPDGTFRLTGTVADGEAPSVRVPGARVEATPGPVVTATDNNGFYRLYGVAPSSEIRVTKTGYLPVVQDVQLTANATRNFQLPLDGPRIQLAGPYTLAIDVAGPCSLPSDLQHRRYDATLSQRGFVVDVTLTEPRFRVNSAGFGNRFSGQVNASGARFFLASLDPYYPYYAPTFGYPDVVERLPDGSHLVPIGSVVVSGSAAELTGVMGSDGSLHRYGPTFPSPPAFLAFCNAQSQITFTLTQR